MIMHYAFLLDVFGGGQDLPHGKAGCIPPPPPQDVLPSSVFHILSQPEGGTSMGLELEGKLNSFIFVIRVLNTAILNLLIIQGLVNDLTFELDKLSEATETPPPNLSEEMKTVDTPQKVKKTRKP